MHRQFTLVFTLLILLYHSSLFAEQPAKHALFVAISKYQHADMNKPQLQYPEDDAKALAEIFQSGGYKVELLLGKDATQKAIRDKLAVLKKQGNADGITVIGLFGNGFENESIGEACFCPFDTTIREVKDTQGKTVFGNDRQPLMEPDPGSLIVISEILAAFHTTPAGHRVLFADCCRSTPNRARSFGANHGLYNLPANTAAFLACSAHEQTYEHKDWGHGAFTQCLLTELPKLIKSDEADTGVLSSRLNKFRHWSKRAFPMLFKIQ
jgi:hypothetical protein